MKLQSPASAEHVPEVKGMGQTGMPRVLLVEDDPSVMRMLSFSLRNAGFDVAGVSTGGALQSLEQGPPDAVVLDLAPPDAVGRVVLARLRKALDVDEDHPAWIVISALDPAEADQRYGPLEGHLLAKPFDPWILIERLWTYLST